MGLFTGKKIVITGASRGVGFEAAKLFLADGAEVFGTGRNQARLDSSATELNQIGVFHPFLADFDHKQGSVQTAEAVKSLWPSLDILINNAAVQSYNHGWFDEDPSLFEKTTRTNVFSPHELTLALTPLLLQAQSPRIVFVSSDAGTTEALRSYPDMPTYRLTKYFLGGLTISWAQTLMGKVAVNAVHPGWLKTDLGGADAPGEPADGGQRIWEVLSLNWDVTGRIFYGSEEMEF